MDPTVVHGLVEIFGPTLGVLAIGLIPISLVFMSKYFKLRTRELELQSQLHGLEAQARIRAMETRQAAMESALQAIARHLTREPDNSMPRPLTEPPNEPAPAPPLSLAKKERD